MKRLSRKKKKQLRTEHRGVRIWCNRYRHQCPTFSKDDWYEFWCAETGRFESPTELALAA